MNFLDWIFYGNSMQKWIIAAGTAVVVLIILNFVRKIVVRKLADFVKKTGTGFDDAVVDLIAKTKFLFLLIIALFIGSFILVLPEKTTLIVRQVVVLAFLVQVAIWSSALINFSLSRYASQRIEKDAASVTTMTALGFISKLIIFVVIFLLALDNLGVDITALIAGLGVGGIAIALAVQNILGDLFASLSIVLDKPFVIGDFIIIGDFLGSVEHIGLKTTRLRSLSGEQLVFSNTDLLQSRIKNYKRMFERRVVFSIGVVYQTPYEKVAAIPAIIRQIIEEQEDVRFDRSHFKEYGDFSLNFETVYWVKNPDYNIYMDIQQAINLKIYQRFEQEGIEFAYPSQTIFLEGDNKSDSNKQGN